MQVNRRTFFHSSAALGAFMAVDGATEALGAGSGTPLPSYSDPMYTEPYIDVDEWRDQPVRHRYVHGGFKGTDLRFIMQFPPKDVYQGRFFQYLTPVVLAEAQALNVFNNDLIGFAADSGAAAVVSNQGGLALVAQHGGGGDPTIGGYRASAAVAMYARKVANEMYGPHRTYGYAFGGSGGGYRTLSGAENTDTWDGTVPFVHGNLQAWPNSYAARARGHRILKNKIAVIADALEPGGSGNPYATLSADERSALEDATRLGFPQRTWIFNDTIGVGPLSVIFQGIQTLDPDYFETFWKTPGYLGHDSPHVFDDVRVRHRARIKRVIMSNDAASAGVPPPPMRGQADPDTAWRTFEREQGAPLPVAIEVDSTPPPGSLLDMANINLLSGSSAGKWLILGGLEGNIALFQFAPAGGNLRNVTDGLRAGDEIQFDNSNILAYETYYRHALLTPDYYVGNFLRKPDGTPIYPQRPKLIAHDLMAGATPTIPNGKYFGKMIVIQNMLDWDAHPWYADWYRTKVKENLGPRFGDNYRLYYVDYATHGPLPDPTRTIPYHGALQQALRDIAAWVERGVAPPPETVYKVTDGQVHLPPKAAERKGIQPVVTLLANGAASAQVKAGEPVEFTAVLETPPGAGSIVAAQWDFLAGPQPEDGNPGAFAGEGSNPGSRPRFTIDEPIAPKSLVRVSKRFTFDKPGTYFPALRAYSQRQGDASSKYARISNLGRVRVIVT